MEKNQFTLSLALVDALPVLFFGAAARLPSAAFFALTIVGMIAMVVCAKRFDRFDVRANWIEQGINAAAQACAMIGVLLLL